MRNRIATRARRTAAAVNARPTNRTQLTHTQQSPASVHKGGVNVPLARLGRGIAERARLGRALAASEEQSAAEWQQYEALRQTNARLRRKVILLGKKVAQARHFAYHDELTGLPNRSLLKDRLKQAMLQAARQHKQVALLLLDLDGFKDVNDTLGHGAGDKLLQQVASRLTACIRGGDTACRYGGDEFVVMLPEIDGQETAATVAEKIRTHLEAPYRIDGEVIAVMASIGTAVYRGAAQECDDLIRQADITMYLAKARIRPLTRSLHRQAPD